MKFSRQTTLRAQATVAGVGVHSGLPVTLTLGPAPVDAGFVFVRTGLEGSDREIQATADQVIATDFATVLGDRDGPLVSTAEHVLAALRGMGVDNATIEIDGPEVPIMDGSAAAFIAAIDQAGIVSQPAQRRFIQVLKPISAKVGDSFGEIRPYANGFRVDIEIDFTNPVIGQQSYGFDLSPERFRREVGRARTFGLMCDVARLWSAGYALGASFDNTVVFDDERLLNTEGLRYADECARHKVLDVNRRPRAGRPAAAWRLPLGAWRSQAQPRCPDRAARRPYRLAGGRGRGRPPHHASRGRSRSRHRRRPDRRGLRAGRVLTRPVATGVLLPPAFGGSFPRETPGNDDRLGLRRVRLNPGEMPAYPVGSRSFFGYTAWSHGRRHGYISRP
ncbi:UDP-3-O-acyl N-acetylglucosamine deacetylase [Bradyrhizobium sp. i1.4.4]